MASAPKSHSTPQKARGCPSGVLRAVRLRHVEAVVYSRCGPVLPDDDSGLEYLNDVLALTPDDIGLRKARKLAPWLSEPALEAILEEIRKTPTVERLSSPVLLGKRLRLTHDERERLKVWQVRPHDFTDDDMARISSEKRRLRQERWRRASGAVPRSEYLAVIASPQPWLSEGISRRTWFRRQKLNGTGSVTLKVKRTESPTQCHISDVSGIPTLNTTNLVCSELSPKGLATDDKRSASVLSECGAISGGASGWGAAI